MNVIDMLFNVAYEFLSRRGKRVALAALMLGIAGVIVWVIATDATLTFGE